MHKKASGIAKNTMCLAFGIIIALIISEVIIRKLDLAPQIINYMGNLRLVDNPHIVYEFIPGSSFIGGGGVINNQGFKDSDFVIRKEENLIRIVMLGDSITEGVFVRLGATFSDVLEVLLNEKARAKGSDLRYEVMNFGVGGYNLEAEVETLKEKALLHNPDIVILNFYRNDGEPLSGLNMFNTNIDEKNRLFIFEKYYTKECRPVYFFINRILFKSKLYLYLLDRFNIYKKYLFVGKKEAAEIADDEFRALRNNITLLEKLKKKLGFKLLVCLHPDLLYADKREDLEKFIPFLKEFNLPYFYMFDYYKKGGISPDNLAVRQGDEIHPNEFGHSLIAQAMLAELEKNNFISFENHIINRVSGPKL